MSTETKPSIQGGLAARTPSGGQLLAWRSWTLRDEPRRSARYLLAMVLGGVLVVVVTGKVYLAVLAWAALMLAAWHMWLPRSFVADGRGVTRTVCGRRRYVDFRDVRRVELSQRGALLTLDDRNGGTAHGRWRLFLPYGNQPSQVQAALRHSLRMATSSAGNDP